MTIIRQTSLFSIQELYDMEPTQKYDAIISAIDLDAIHYEVSKKSRFGAWCTYRIELFGDDHFNFHSLRRAYPNDQRPNQTFGK